MATEPKAVRRMAGFTQVKIKAKRADANTLSAVPLTVAGTTGQTGDLLQITNVSGTVLTKITAAGNLVQTAAASLATPFGLGQIGMARAKYDFAVDGGAISVITPATNCVIPDNAIIFGGLINPTTAPVGVNATIGFGTSAGSSAASLKTATAIASYTLDVLLAVVPVWTAATAFKMTAAGSITMSVATTALTAGVIEITVFYWTAAA